MLNYPSVASSAVPKMLGVLLLLATSLTAQVTGGENYTCTQTEMSVPRGQRFFMACEFSYELGFVTIRILTRGRESVLFNEWAPGYFHWYGWHLYIQGGKAWMEVEAAQEQNMGMYIWRIYGHEDHYKLFTVKFLEPQDQEEAARCGPSMPSWEVQQSPRYVVIPEGGSINITCSTQRPLHRILLKQRQLQPLVEIFYEDGTEFRVATQFWGRIDFSGSQDNLTITLHHLKQSDSGVYSCQSLVDDNAWGPGTMVMVTEKLSLGAETAGFPAGTHCPTNCSCCQQHPPPARPGRHVCA